MRLDVRPVYWREGTALRHLAFPDMDRTLCGRRYRLRGTRGTPTTCSVCHRLAQAHAGVIYVLHLERPFQHMRHYTGWARDLHGRLWCHGAGRGANVLRHVQAAGISWHLSSVYYGDRHEERRMKRLGGAARCCVECREFAKVIGKTLLVTDAKETTMTNPPQSPAGGGLQGYDAQSASAGQAQAMDNTPGVRQSTTVVQSPDPNQPDLRAAEEQPGRGQYEPGSDQRARLEEMTKAELHEQFGVSEDQTKDEMINEIASKNTEAQPDE